jgi:hypothetical protein
MSREAIAAALAREELSCGERLVAFSFASFADRENRARSGRPAAAARAGLERSAYLQARDRLERRGLVVVEVPASGRGKASTVALPFVSEGPWWDGDINAELFEAVLGYSRAQGSARLLIAAMAALADEHRVVAGLTTEQLCAAAGVSDRTYRRVHEPLLASGELVVRSSAGGRGNTNRWEIPHPRSHTTAAARGPRRRLAPPGGARPLLASVTPPVDEQMSLGVPERAEGELSDQVLGAVKGGQDRTVSPENRPALSGVSGVKGCQDRTVSPQNRPASSVVSVRNPCQDRTVSSQTPAKTPAKTPAPNAPAGREPQNPRTHPPNPPEGGSGADRVLVEENYVTDRGRRRRRQVPVDLAALRRRLRAAGEEDLAAWEQVRTILREAVGESVFEIWLARLELIALDLQGTLIVSAPPETAAWVTSRFRGVLDSAAQRAGRPFRIANEVERTAAESLAPAAAAAGTAPGGVSADAPTCGHVGSEPCAADASRATSVGSLTDGQRGRWDDQSIGKPTYSSAYPSSYADGYTQTLEVS